MPKSEKLYEVTQTWEHEETRIVEAKSPKEAAEKAKDRYIDVLGWNLVGFINTESVKEVKRANYKLNNGKLAYPREPRKLPKHR
jgi:hypothetical protein